MKPKKETDLEKLFKEVLEEVKERLKKRGYLIGSKSIKFSDKEIIRIWKFLSQSTDSNGNIYIKSELYCKHPELRNFLLLNTDINFDNKCKESSGISVSSPSLRRKSTISVSSPSLRRKSTISVRSPSLRRKSTISVRSPSLRRKSTISVRSPSLRRKSAI